MSCADVEEESAVLLRLVARSAVGSRHSAVAVAAAVGGGGGKLRKGAVVDQINLYGF